MRRQIDPIISYCDTCMIQLSTDIELNQGNYLSLKNPQLAFVRLLLIKSWRKVIVQLALIYIVDS